MRGFYAIFFVVFCLSASAGEAVLCDRQFFSAGDSDSKMTSVKFEELVKKISAGGVMMGSCTVSDITRDGDKYIITGTGNVDEISLKYKVSTALPFAKDLSPRAVVAFVGTFRYVAPKNNGYSVELVVDATNAAVMPNEKGQKLSAKASAVQDKIKSAEKKLDKIKEPLNVAAIGLNPEKRAKVEEKAKPVVDEIRRLSAEMYCEQLKSILKVG